MFAWSVATALAVAALLFFERSGQAAGVWLAKPFASTAFIAVALAAGALQSTYGCAILLGLVLSWLGDVLLIPRGRPHLFLAGVLSFLAGHVAYAAAFVARGVDAGAFAAAALGAGAVAIVVLRWLGAHVPADMKVAVPAYIAVISLMVTCATASFAAQGNPWIPVGAVGFYLSDLSVARDRFVASEFVNRLWGLPLYYAAQVALAWSIHAERGLVGGGG
jgi:uncharacterized membrane protein YhhN